MVLNSEEWELAMADPFDRSIVQIEMGYLERGCARHPCRVSNHREAMILGGNEHLLCADVAYRMVAASVPVGQLGRGAAVRKTDQLMPEADSKSGKAAAGERTYVIE